MFSDYQRAGPRGKFMCASMENLTGVAFLYGKLHGGAIRMEKFTGVVLLHVTALTNHSPNPSTALPAHSPNPPTAPFGRNLLSGSRYHRRCMGESR